MTEEWEAVLDTVSGEWWIEGLDSFVHGEEDETSEEVAAKAYKVAAAPDMLAECEAALQFIVKQLREECAMWQATAEATQQFVDTHERVRALRDVIAKAKGREAQAEIAHIKQIREDYVSRADVATVLVELRDALTADGQAAKGDARLMMNGAVGRVQSAMSQLGVEY